MIDNFSDNDSNEQVARYRGVDIAFLEFPGLMGFIDGMVAHAFGPRLLALWTHNKGPVVSTCHASQMDAIDNRYIGWGSGGRSTYLSTSVPATYNATYNRSLLKAMSRQSVPRCRCHLCDGYTAMDDNLYRSLKDQAEEQAAMAGPRGSTQLFIHSLTYISLSFINHTNHIAHLYSHFLPSAHVTHLLTTSSTLFTLPIPPHLKPLPVLLSTTLTMLLHSLLC